MRGLRTEGLLKSFGGIKALREVSLCFPEAGVVALAGPNGAGKTTLLNIITGFLKPDSGHCYINGHQSTDLSPDRVFHLGLVRTFQELRLVRRLPVIDNVLLASYDHSSEGLLQSISSRQASRKELLKHQTALNLLTEFGLGDVVDRSVSALSYGQQKLLSLACCYSTGAHILLLDEPVSGVDPLNLRKISQAIANSRESKLTVIVEHDIGFIREISDRVIVMDHGSVIADGLPSEVFALAEVSESFLG